MKNRALGNKLNSGLIVGNSNNNSGSSNNNNIIGIQHNIVNTESVTNNNMPLQQQPPLQQQQRIVSEWEDNVLFDVDDPDFCNLAPNVVNTVLNTATVALNNLHLKVPSTATTTATTTMSLARVQNPQFADQFCSPLVHSSLGMSASLPDLVGSPLEISVDQSTMLTIEELRQHMGSCFTCGVSWTDDHVSLDCSECGGYSLERPCPLCDGECGVQWKRDFTMSHACSKARWVGVCTSYPEAAVVPVATAAAAAAASTVANATTCATAAAAATQLRLAQELCSRLEQLSSTGTTRI